MHKKYAITEHEDKDGTLRYFVMQTNSRKRFGDCEGYSADRTEAQKILGLARGLERERQKELAKRRAEQRERFESYRAETRSQIEVGSILYTSWGYDQTNVEFYQVVDTYGKWGVVLRQICAETVKATSPDSARIRPVPDSWATRAVHDPDQPRYEGDTRGRWTGDEPKPAIRKTVGACGVKIHSSATAYPAGDREDFHSSSGH